MQTDWFSAMWLYLQTKHKSSYNNKTVVENVKVNANIVKYSFFSKEGERERDDIILILQSWGLKDNVNG